jgi:hypothetical protein
MMGRPPKLPPLKLLQQAMGLKTERGACIHRSAAFVFDVPGSSLIFATVRGATPEEREAIPEASPVPFIHAWAEYKGWVYAPTTIERAGGFGAMDRAEYYRLNGARDFRILTRPMLLRLDRQHGLKHALKRGGPAKSGESFGGLLLDAAGVEWAIIDGGLVPRPDVQVSNNEEKE